MPRKTAGRAAGVALAQNNYGKSRVRVVKVKRETGGRASPRNGTRHTVQELSVDISLQGEFEAVHTRADNSKCLPTDTMKNTVYALARDHPIDSIEDFALHLARHFVDRNRQVSSATVAVQGTPWARVRINSADHPHCFIKGGDERAVCEVTVDRRRGVNMTGGIDGLVILKSTNSAFSGFLRDEYTTLKETEDRIMATSVTARWSYAPRRSGRTGFAACRDRVRNALITAFAAHKSRSVQHTLHAMGEAALKKCPQIDSIRLSLPNKHCLLVDLSPFGRSNDNEIFVPTDEPHGLIEGTITRR